MSQRPVPSLQPEEWLVQRLEHIARHDPRFEASWYGPYNALLSHYFPYQQRFLIKPQPKIRDVYEEGFSLSSIRAESSMEVDSSPDDSFAANLSMTSLGALALPGSGSNNIPDFIVTKATQFASHDIALLLVEVKGTEPVVDSDWVTHEHQMDRYMDTVAKQMSMGARLIGLLVCGTMVKIFRLESPGSEVEMDIETHSINSDIVRRLLLTIAEENWDY